MATVAYYDRYCTDPESESPSFAEITRTKNMIEVKYNVPPKEEFDQTLHVSKKMTFKELKALMSPVVGLAVDEFKVKDYYSLTKTSGFAGYGTLES